MADVCILYAKPDRTSAEALHALLEKPWDVWWDDDIVGSHVKAIEREVPRSKCAVPVWSASSRDRDTVLDEMRLARKHQVPLVPVRIDDSDPPYNFGSGSYVDLRGWVSGVRAHETAGAG